MQPAPYKVCPRCQRSHELTATHCPCGRAFRTPAAELAPTAPPAPLSTGEVTRRVLLLALPAAAFLLFRGLFSRPPYTITERTEGTGAVFMKVQVKPRTSRTLLLRWVFDLKKQVPGGKDLVANFYDGPPSVDTLIGQYSGETLGIISPERVPD